MRESSGFQPLHAVHTCIHLLEATKYMHIVATQQFFLSAFKGRVVGARFGLMGLGRWVVGVRLGFVWLALASVGLGGVGVDFACCERLRSGLQNAHNVYMHT